MAHEAISTDGAPGAVGPYSQAIATGSAIYCSGQIGLDPETGKLADGIEAQTHQALRNLAAVLEAAGLSFGDVVKTTIWLTDSAHFSQVNAIYAEYMGNPPPARSAPVVAAIPYPGALLSIEAIAERGGNPS